MARRLVAPDGRLGTLVTRGRFKVIGSPPVRTDFTRRSVDVPPTAPSSGNPSAKPRKFSISTISSPLPSRTPRSTAPLPFPLPASRLLVPLRRRQPPRQLLAAPLLRQALGEHARVCGRAVWRDQAAKLAKKNSTHEGEDKSRSTFDASSGSNKSRNIREDGPRKRKGKHEAIFDEWEELAREERLYKKLRKGKITQKQFDRGVKGGDIAEDSDIDMNEDSDEVQ